ELAEVEESSGAVPPWLPRVNSKTVRFAGTVPSAGSAEKGDSSPKSQMIWAKDAPAVSHGSKMSRPEETAGASVFRKSIQRLAIAEMDIFLGMRVIQNIICSDEYC